MCLPAFTGIACIEFGVIKVSNVPLSRSRPAVPLAGRPRTYFEERPLQSNSAHHHVFDCNLPFDSFGNDAVEHDGLIVEEARAPTQRLKLDPQIRARERCDLGG